LAADCSTLKRHAISRVCSAFVIALRSEAIASEKRAGSVTHVLRIHKNFPLVARVGQL
jgi:hypothetical protein